MSSKKFDIYKAAGVIIVDRKLLLTRSKGGVHFFSPGGKLESEETPVEAAIRELKEELSISVKPEQLTSLGEHYMPASDKPDLMLRQESFLVESWEGELKASGEIEELGWVTHGNPQNLRMGHIFEKIILPLLYEQGLVD